MKVKIESAFIQAGVDVRDGDIIKFLNEGEEKANPKFDNKKQFSILVRTDEGVEKKMSINNTSKRNMIATYGDDSKDWVLKDARVNIIKQLVSGELKSVIILTAPNIDLEGNPIIQ